MEESADIQKLIELALDPNELSLVSFASQIDRIVPHLSPTQLTDDFLPFLETWLPCDSEKVMLQVSKAIPAIGRAVENLASLAKLLTRLIACDCPPVSTNIKDAISCFRADKSLEDLILELLKSRFDNVRKFAVSLFEYSTSEDFIAQRCKELVNDTSFLVKEAAVLALKQIENESIVKDIALMYMRDKQSRIRALICTTCSKREFFIASLAPVLVVDTDWIVRATLAKQLANVCDRQNATDFCLDLIEDHTWQVKMAALKSLSGLLEYIEYGEAKSLVSSFKEYISCPQIQLKLQIVDSFLVICVHFRDLDIVAMKPFVNSLMAQTAQVKAYFFKALAATHDPNLLCLLPSKIGPILQSLADDSRWRTRVIVAEMLMFYVTLGHEQIVTLLRAICTKLVEDEAYDVRHAAATSLGFLVAKSGSVPEEIAQMASCERFRVRQSFLVLLGTVKRYSRAEEVQRMCDEHIGQLQNDPCLQVQALASAVANTVSPQFMLLSESIECK